MSALQELLNIGLVPIGPDDSLFEKVASASKALAAEMKTHPDVLIPATIIAIDDDVQEDAALFSTVEDILTKEWNTLRNTHVDRPCALLRSIIVDALSEVADSSPEAAGVVWSTATSRLRHGHVSLGRTRDVVMGILMRASDKSEAEAVDRAGLVATSNRPTKAKKDAVDNASLSSEYALKQKQLLMKVVRAAGPSDEQGKSLNDPNPYWPDQAQHWSYEFAPRMAAAIADAVNLGTARLIASIGEQIPAYLKAVENHLRGELRAIAQFHKASQMRLDVLWWSTSLYSPSRRVGYQDLPVPIAAVTAALDLAAIVPSLAPASVGYILLETVRRIARLVGFADQQPIVGYLDSLSSVGIDFDSYLGNSTVGESCVPLLSIVAEVSGGGRVSRDELRARSGVDGEKIISAGEFAMWVFHDLQARRLADAAQ